jgi:hypothetical protein
MIVDDSIMAPRLPVITSPAAAITRPVSTTAPAIDSSSPTPSRTSSRMRVTRKIS